jgi:hypothetical protein
VMAVGMLWVSFLPSTAENAWTYLRILPGLLMIGVGMGIGFPSLNVGAMGAVAGPELGLASGVLNTARQLGAAIGVAILIATFGGVLHAHMCGLRTATSTTSSMTTTCRRRWRTR